MAAKSGGSQLKMFKEMNTAGKSLGQQRAKAQNLVTNRNIHTSLVASKKSPVRKVEVLDYSNQKKHGKL